MLKKEETLDPENWEELTKLGHKMIDDLMNHLKTIREQPFKPPTVEALKTLLTPLAEKGEGEEAVYQLFKESMLPHTLKWTRPDFWGYVIGTGSPFGMLTDMALSGVNHGSGALLMSLARVYHC